MSISFALNERNSPTRVNGISNCTPGLWFKDATQITDQRIILVVGKPTFKDSVWDNCMVFTGKNAACVPVGREWDLETIILRKLPSGSQFTITQE
jgi:hypothetical protein